MLQSTIEHDSRSLSRILSCTYTGSSKQSFTDLYLVQVLATSGIDDTDQIRSIMEDDGTKHVRYAAYSVGTRPAGPKLDSSSPSSVPITKHA